MEMELTVLAYGALLGAVSAVLLWALPTAYLAATQALGQHLRSRYPQLWNTSPRTGDTKAITRARSFGL